VSFTYHDDWLGGENAFGLSPDMPLVKGQFAPEAGQHMLAPLGDSAPDTWGRTVMRRFEGRMAATEGRRPRTLQEADYLLGVNDETRLGELRAITVEHSSLPFMQAHKDRFDDAMMRRLSEESILPLGSDSAKVRVGNVGDHELSADTVAAIMTKWRELVAPATGFDNYETLIESLR
jgi:hypothetical protein